MEQLHKALSLSKQRISEMNMKKQQGFVLVFTVVLLLVAAILGLYAMRSTIMQDKMTANIYNKTITINAAEKGASEFANWFKNYVIDHNWPNNIEQENFSVYGEIPTIPNHTTKGKFGDNGYYWIDPSEAPNESGCSVNPCWDNIRNEVTVLIKGQLVKGENTNRVVLGESIYKIKLKADLAGSLKLPDLPAAITIAGEIQNFGANNSHKFTVFGGGKAAVATMYDSGQDLITTNIKNNDNNGKVSKGYNGSGCTNIPCVVKGDLGIWGNAKDLMKYINSIKNDPTVAYHSQSITDASLDFTKPVNIVAGNYTQNGNMPNYNGVLIVLGADNSIIHGGGGANFNGAMYFANIIQQDGQFSFGKTSLSTSGSHMNIKYDSQYFGDSSNTTPTNTKTTILSWSDQL